MSTKADTCGVSLQGWPATLLSGLSGLGIGFVCCKFRWPESKLQTAVLRHLQSSQQWKETENRLKSQLQECQETVTSLKQQVKGLEKKLAVANNDATFHKSEADKFFDQLTNAVMLQNRLEREKKTAEQQVKKEMDRADAAVTQERLAQERGNLLRVKLDREELDRKDLEKKLCSESSRLKEAQTLKLEAQQACDEATRKLHECEGDIAGLKAESARLAREQQLSKEDCKSWKELYHTQQDALCNAKTQSSKFQDEAKDAKADCETLRIQLQQAQDQRDRGNRDLNKQERELEQQGKDLAAWQTSYRESANQADKLHRHLRDEEEKLLKSEQEVERLRRSVLEHEQSRQVLKSEVTVLEGELKKCREQCQTAKTENEQLKNEVA